MQLSKSGWVMADDLVTDESHGKEDRISCLPDEILSHILSKLPTKYAVATSLLSSRWKFVWTSISNLCFDDHHWQIDGYALVPNLRFENFVNRVLDLTNPTTVGKFSLYYRKLSDLSLLKSWVTSLIMRNVREIELRLNYDERVQLPEGIFTSNTLEVLKLHSDFIIQIPRSGICFPSLKVLTVYSVHPDQDDFMSPENFSACPVLEDLSITVFSEDSDFELNLNITSTTVKRLSLVIDLVGNFSSLEHKIMIRAPNLDLLNIAQNAMASCIVDELHSLTKAAIGLVCVPRSRVMAGRAIQLLNSFTKTKFLFLSDGTISAIDYAYENIFPTFSNLTSLSVEIVGGCGWRMLPVMFNSSPNLEKFILLETFNYFGYKDEDEEEPGWVDPLCVPTCLLQHVETIELRQFDGHENVMGMVKYMLKNCEVLTKMKFRCSVWASEEELEALHSEILELERVSKTCEVEFLR